MPGLVMQAVQGEVARKQSPASPHTHAPLPQQLQSFMSSQQHGVAGILAMAASNDLTGIRWAIEQEGIPIDSYADFACRRSDGELLERHARTALMVASFYGAIDVLNYLTSAGTDVNFKSPDDGSTALHCAAAGGGTRSVEVIAMLLRCGADRDAVDCENRRPVDMILAGRDPQALKHDELVTMTLIERLLDVHSPRSDHASPTALAGENDLYSSDDFRMFEFKVRRCMRARSHDWTECPFAHPGEKARRRDPRKYNYSGIACPDFRKGACRRGDACEFAHGVFECWLHPTRYRTQPCKDGRNCRRRICFFAHTTEQLRPLPPALAALDMDGSPMPGSPTTPLGMAFSPPHSPLSSSPGSAYSPQFSPSHYYRNEAVPNLSLPPTAAMRKGPIASVASAPPGVLWQHAMQMASPTPMRAPVLTHATSAMSTSAPAYYPAARQSAATYQRRHSLDFPRSITSPIGPQFGVRSYAWDNNMSPGSSISPGSSYENHAAQHYPAMRRYSQPMPQDDASDMNKWVDELVSTDAEECSVDWVDSLVRDSGNDIAPRFSGLQLL
eukprot:jgi/Chlat1/2624/Chrsp178S02466